MISNRGRIGAGEARLPRALHRAPYQKTHKHIPRITHSPATMSNLRLDIPQLRLYIPQHTSATDTYSNSKLDIQQHTSPSDIEERNRLTNSLSANEQKMHKPSFMRFDQNTMSCGCVHPTTHTHSSHTHRPPDTENNAQYQHWTHTSPPSLSLKPSHGVEARGGGVEQWATEGPPNPPHDIE